MGIISRKKPSWNWFFFQLHSVNGVLNRLDFLQNNYFIEVKNRMWLCECGFSRRSYRFLAYFSSVSCKVYKRLIHKIIGWSGQNIRNLLLMVLRYGSGGRFIYKMGLLMESVHEDKLDINMHISSLWWNV